MTTAKHQESPRRSAAPAARQTKRPAPALVAGLPPASPVPADLSDLLADFTRLDALAAGADALLAQHVPPCPHVAAVRRALAQAADVADKARDAADECNLGRHEGGAGREDALRALALRARSAGSMLDAARALLESADWESALPLVRALCLLDASRELVATIAASLWAHSQAALAARVAA